MPGPSGGEVAIVGAGPWGSYALERLAARRDQLREAGVVSVVVADSAGSFGDGRIHSADQVRTSRLNRVASQVGFGADEALPEAPLLPAELRPTLAEWSAHDPDVETVAPTDIPPRAVHGLALRAAFQRWADHLRAAGVAVECVHGTVVAARPGADGVELELVDETGSRLRTVRAVLLTTGHGTGEVDAAGAALSGPYPLAQGVTTATAAPGSTVALAGAGLTSLDVILHLTEGRGGRFVPQGQGLRYESSGDEPARILPVSPSGLLPSARPRNQKAADASGRGHRDLELHARWFTTAAVDRRAAADEPLDFDRDLLPLVVAEMALAYYTVLAGPEHVEPLARPVDDVLAAGPADQPPPTVRELTDLLHTGFTDLWSHDEGVRDRARAVLAPLPTPPWWGDRPLDPARLRFDWPAVTNPLVADAGPAWAARALDLMRWDLACAEQGNLDNPWKAAWDGVWRDLRPVLSRVLDFDTLSPTSKQAFLETHWRTYTRQVNGAGIETMAKVVALVEAGVVDLSAGPGARAGTDPDGRQVVHALDADGEPRSIEVDVVVPARVPRTDPSTEPPYAQLVRDGVLTTASRDGTTVVLDLTRELHPRSATGHVERRISVLGAPSEGVVFFQLALARPHSASSVVRTVERWAQELVTSLL